MTTDKTKFRNYAPFGFRDIRETRFGIHPALDQSGSNRTQFTSAGPGQYNPQKPVCKYKNGIDWERKLKVEEFSKWMGWKNLAILENRRFFQSLNGPGTHDINPDLFKQKHCSTFENVHFTLGKRYSYINPPETPSPDRYFSDLNKLSSIKEDSNKVPTFERDGFVNRFRASVGKNYWLPSNLYDVTKIDGKNTADISKKLVSVRGPYDLFTGIRDDSNLKGFYHPRIFKMPEWFYMPPSMAELILKSPNRSRSGKFFQDVRFPKKPTVRHMLTDVCLCYRDPNDPGPATYDMNNYKGILPKKPGMYSFDTCKVYARPQISEKQVLSPGPGRYNIRVGKFMKLKRNSWVFQSSYPRTAYRDFNYRSF